MILAVAQRVPRRRVPKRSQWLDGVAYLISFIFLLKFPALFVLYILLVIIYECIKFCADLQKYQTIDIIIIIGVVMS